MKIWLINNYTMLPEHGPMTRQYYFAKELSARGHEVTVFAGSHIHNSDIQLVEGERWKIWQEQPFRWVYVHTLAYGKSRKKQILSMFQFYRNTAIAAQYFRKQYGTPDVILGSSAHPLTALLAVRLGQKYRCKSIAEIRDLWPESIVAFGIAGPHNPAVLALRRLEKWIYKKADAVVFTMEGAYDYIVEQGWGKEIPRSKVHHINNGVDLELFDYNKEHFRAEDPDLDDPNIFKVIYTGSVRRVNNLGLLVDAAKCIKDPRVKLLIWGDGDEREALERRVRDEKISNVVFKGKVEKKYIPSIVRRADLNLVHWEQAPLLKYGVSYNKLFDYMAAGRPIFSTVCPGYSIWEKYDCGRDTEDTRPEPLARELEKMAALPPEELSRLGENAREGSRDYDFRVLTQKLLNVIGENE